MQWVELKSWGSHMMLCQWLVSESLSLWPNCIPAILPSLESKIQHSKCKKHLRLFPTSNPWLSCTVMITTLQSNQMATRCFNIKRLVYHTEKYVISPFPSSHVRKTNPPTWHMVMTTIWPALENSPTWNKTVLCALLARNWWERARQQFPSCNLWKIWRYILFKFARIRNWVTHTRWAHEAVENMPNVHKEHCNG